MNRKRRTKIMAEDFSGCASNLAGQIREKYKVFEVQPPKEGLVMVKIREQARNTVFYFGEVLVTEAKVRLTDENGASAGLGIVQGVNPELAADMAVVDAAFNAGLPEIPAMTELLLKAEKQNEIRASLERGKVMKTKVSFSSMQKEDYMG